MTHCAQLTLLEEADYLLLVRQAAHSATPCRDRALVHIFWHLAPTVRGVIGLRLDDFHPEDGAMGWPDGRRLTVPPPCLEALGTYLRVERAPRRGVDHLFCGRHGLPLRPDDVAALFRRLSAATGLAVDPLVLRRGAFDRSLRLAPERALGLLRTRAQGGPVADVAPAAACSAPSST